jgi:hypothetical protein
VTRSRRQTRLLWQLHSCRPNFWHKVPLNILALGIDAAASTVTAQHINVNADQAAVAGSGQTKGNYL